MREENWRREEGTCWARAARIGQAWMGGGQWEGETTMEPKKERERTSLGMRRRARELRLLLVLVLALLGAETSGTDVAGNDVEGVLDTGMLDASEHADDAEGVAV